MLSESNKLGVEDSNIERAEPFYEAIRDSTLENERILENKVIGTWEMSFTSDFKDGIEGVHARGYFKAPRTGEYKFWFAADNFGLVYLNTTPNVASITDDD